MKIDAVIKEANGIVLKAARGKIKIEVCTGSIIRCIYTMGEFSPKPSLMVIRKDYPAAAWEFAETEAVVELTTGSLLVKVRKDTGAISCFDRQGNLLMKERPGRQAPGSTEVGNGFYEHVHHVRGRSRWSQSQAECPGGEMHCVRKPESNGIR